MLTINYLIENKTSINSILTNEDKTALLLENKDNDFSYLSLMREMFFYKHITVSDLLKGWGGIKLVSINKLK